MISKQNVSEVKTKKNLKCKARLVKTERKYRMSNLARIMYVCKQGKRQEPSTLGLVIRTKWLTKKEPSVCEGGYGCRSTEHYSTSTVHQLLYTSTKTG